MSAHGPAHAEALHAARELWLLSRGDDHQRTLAAALRNLGQIAAIGLPAEGPALAARLAEIADALVGERVVSDIEPVPATMPGAR